jgi:1,2-diacylglycerol 3-alpha-glucosyltransferase
MNILMVSDVFFPRVNGVSTSIQSFTDSLRVAGHQVTLIAPEYPEACDSEFPVIRVPSRRLPFDPEDRLMSLRYIKKLVDQLKHQSFDVVHIQTPFVAHYAGLYLADRLNIPRVVSYHTYFEAYFEKYLTWLPSGLLRRVARYFSASQCNQVDGIISPSHQMLEKLREYGARTYAEIIPTGLRLEDYQYRGDGTFRQQYGIGEEDSVLLYVGRVAHEKNIPFLIDVFQEVYEQKDNVRFVIAGEGPALKSLKHRVNGLAMEDQVIFVGYLDRYTELMACYHSADVFVFASETETQGLVLLEAMACGLPVVSVASMGSEDVLVDGQGCLVAPLDVTAFAEKVCDVLVEPGLSERLSATALDYVKSWSIQAKTHELEKFYQAVIQRFPRRVQVPETSRSVTQES